MVKSHNMEIKIQPARRDQAPAIASLIMTAMTDECCLSFCGEGYGLDDFRRMMTLLAEREDSQYSYLNTLVAMDGIRVAGIAVSYDGARLTELRRPFLQLALLHIGRDHSGMGAETQAGELYLDSLAVLPEYRRRGLMTETLTQLLQNAKEQSFDLALLSPAIPDLYVPFGFVPLTYAMRTEETAATPDELQLITETPDPIRHLVIYLACARSHPLMLLRNQKQFQLAMQEYKADGGRTIRTIDGNGYLCFLPGENGVEVTECFAASPAHYRLLLRAAAAFSPSKTASADLPIDCGLPGTLIRPVHGLALKSNVPLDRIAKLRKTYIVEHY